MFTLWCIFRSPLILGGELRENRQCDEEIIMNKELIDLDRFSTDNRQLEKAWDKAIWACKDKDGKDVVALFNISDEEKEISLDLCEYDIEPKDTVCDLWTKEVTAFTGSSLSKKIAPHSVWAVRIG